MHLADQLEEWSEKLPPKVRDEFGDFIRAVEDLENEANADCSTCGEAIADAEEAQEELHHLAYEVDVLLDAKRCVKDGEFNQALELIDRCLPERLRYAI